MVTSDVYFFFSSLISGQRQCKPCPPNTYAMLGASECLPLPNCTTDDKVDAPGDLNTCLCTSQSDIQCNTTVHPYFVTVQGELNEVLCRVTLLEIMENYHACKSVKIDHFSKQSSSAGLFKTQLNLPRISKTILFKICNVKIVKFIFNAGNASCWYHMVQMQLLAKIGLDCSVCLNCNFDVLVS